MSATVESEAPPAERDEALESLEIELLIEAIWRRHGFDFRDYERATVRRAARHAVTAEGLASITGLMERLLHEPPAMARFIAHVGGSGTGPNKVVAPLFGDPEFYLALREAVVPLLESHPFIRVWHAGCGTGEEVFSTAIVLHERGLLERCRIYATDLNESAIRRGQAATFPRAVVEGGQEEYRMAGGAGALEDYFEPAPGDGEQLTIQPMLRRNLVFAPHNLVTDGSFNEFTLILCRNVLTSFNAHLQERVLKLMSDSLRRFGVLALGREESLAGTQVEEGFDVIDELARLYRKRA